MRPIMSENENGERRIYTQKEEGLSGLRGIEWVLTEPKPTPNRTVTEDEGLVTVKC